MRTVSPLGLSPAQESWLAATFDRNRARFGDLRMEADNEADAGGDDADDDSGDSGSGEPKSDSGQKSFADMSDAEKVEFFTAKTRKLEDQLKGKSPDRDARARDRRMKDLERRVAEADKLKETLEEAGRTEAEKAIRRATEDGQKAGREAALAEARKTYGSELVGVKLDAAAERKGMTVEQIRTVAGDLSRFLDEDGVDSDALTQWIDSIPDRTVAAQKKIEPGDLGGGTRPGTNKQSGADLWAARNPNRAAATQ